MIFQAVYELKDKYGHELYGEGTKVEWQGAGWYAAKLRYSGRYWTQYRLAGKDPNKQPNTINMGCDGIAVWYEGYELEYTE